MPASILMNFFYSHDKVKVDDFRLFFFIYASNEDYQIVNMNFSVPGGLN